MKTTLEIIKIVLTNSDINTIVLMGFDNMTPLEAVVKLTDYPDSLWNFNTYTYRILNIWKAK